LVISEGGKHHICYSNDCEDWFNEVFNFLQSKEETNYDDSGKMIASDAKSCYSI